MNKPNLFIVGEPKSGTSALYEMLKQHPDIYMCEEKEPSYFCKDFLEESLKTYGKNTYNHCVTLEEYFNLYTHAQDEAIVGEASTAYLYSKQAAKEIHAFNPKAKIIMLFREPVEFMHSLHSQYVSETAENEPDFKKALALEESRKKGQDIPLRGRCPSYLLYKARTDYPEHLRRFVELFPKDQILVIIFEEFQKNNLSYLKSIFRFLNVDESVQPAKKVTNISKTVRFWPLYHLIQSQRIKRFFWRILNVRMYFYIKKIIDKIFFKPQKREEIGEQLRAQLKKELLPMVCAFNNYLHREQLTQTDLSELWGYKIT